ncbi:uncharacterized protein BJ212DRAFT_1476929 [Suillus subaureus]|uniref:Uncharacterized protein n=1 Tax=Suillus subaureus TaxID=48587 RepID=A0A9P7EHV4_9AGAM|nr:uncharacterized protein BJ212DRAFT_1476929 [Suillus subaureus]KAG1822503.1 hypothetical protein BJ212DRAFT_1476929 [Suillus subaureus]
MTSTAYASKLTPATAIVGMQGYINDIGNILEKVVSGAQGAAFPPVPIPISPPVILKIRDLSAFEHVIHMMQTEVTDLPADDLGILMKVFFTASNDWVIEIYAMSAHTEAHYSFVKALVTTHKISRSEIQISNDLIYLYLPSGIQTLYQCPTPFRLPLSLDSS